MGGSGWRNSAVTNRRRCIKTPRSGAERSGEARDEGGEAPRGLVATALAVAARHPLFRRPPAFSLLLIFRAKVGNTGILITAGHRGNSVGPTNHGARPINSRPYCGGRGARWMRSGGGRRCGGGNGRRVQRHSGLFPPSPLSSFPHGASHASVTNSPST